MKILEKKTKIKATITLLTGLHIGGNQDSVEIGGIDRPVIKMANKRPYIPGSSLKGKMRCLLEQSFGIAEPGETGNEKNKGHIYIKDLWGCGGDKGQASRLIVRDAALNKQSAEELMRLEDLDMPFTEDKCENKINRLNAKANPRHIERVPAGAKFDAEFIINTWSGETFEDQCELFREGIHLLRCDYLGGHGSRGYGQIEIKFTQARLYNHENNWLGEDISHQTVARFNTTLLNYLNSDNEVQHI